MTREALWPFSLEIYAREGVEAALLQLQDAHGQSAPYLLWALWMGASGRRAGSATLGTGAALARSWQDVAVSPLRDIRRGLKRRIGPVRAAARRQLRDRVASLELEAERMLLRMLEDASPPPTATRMDAGRCLRHAISAWGGAAPAELVDRLAELAA
jgi:uncharacterized protein (TIGR02444 family)